MKQSKAVNRKRVSKKASVRNSKKTMSSRRFAKLYIIIATVAILALGAGVSALLPSSSPLSLASLTGKNTDRVAPKLDTLKGNYSRVYWVPIDVYYRHDWPYQW